jgi:hypothetical protein
MNEFRMHRAALPLVTFALLATVLLLLNAPNRHIVASGRSLSPLPQDLQQFEGCWAAGGYSLYIAVIDNELKGKIRCNCQDPQKIYDIKVHGKIIDGKWASDPDFGAEKKTRAGIFAMTRNGDELNGTATETNDSEVVEFRGTNWPWNWKRQTDTKMCDNAK